jgi:DNA-binding IclR family transcriptional regulator
MRTVPALDRGLRILALLAQGNGRMRVAEIAETLGLPRSATYELINTLAAHDAIRQFDNGEVGLGQQMLVLGSAYGRGMDFAQIAQSIAETVMQASEETVQIGVLDGRSVLYIAKADSRQVVRLVSTVGARLPAHCTALGKVLLAYLPEGELASRLGGAELERLTERSITDAGYLKTHLAQVRKQGFASEECESNIDVACVAAPVLDAHGKNVAAISISVPMGRMSPERMLKMREIVITGAARMSAQLGAAASGVLA